MGDGERMTWKGGDALESIFRRGGFIVLVDCDLVVLGREEYDESPTAVSPWDSFV